ncbi:MAG: glycoside hydrolase family 3 C-terminal domain-containing protein [Bacteroidota bacterium]|nr:glycoside hydrolase family 3 C-terminal domain-containing protein [Bacteroidota bacterium]
MKTYFRYTSLIAAILCLISSSLFSQQSALDKRVDDLVNAMTTEEKINQLINVGFGGTPANTRLNIPGFLMSDGPHGVRFTADGFGRTATSFPTGIAMTATWDEELAKKVGEAMGLEFWAFNRNQMLGPCIDLARDSRGGRTAESGGEDPFLSGHLGKAMTIGVQKFPVIATLKHFMGESKQINRMNMNVLATERWLMDFSGYNFRTVVQDAGVLSVMGAYNSINGAKCSESSLLLNTILRERWGFPFYVVSDWASIGDAKKAILAGTDVCMGSSIYAADLPTLVANNLITTADLDRAVKKELKTKILNGMLDYFPKGNASYAKTSEIQAVNKLAAQKSIILLKNAKKSDNSPILPLKKTGITVALIGPNAMAENLNCYGSSRTYPSYAISVKEGLEAKIGATNVQYAKGCDVNSTSTTGFDAAKAIAAAADIVIFAGGIDSTQEGEGYGTGHDRTGDSFALPAIQQQLINELAAVNPNIVTVIQSGGVCSLNSCLSSIKGLVYSFYASQEAGTAIADVLFGDYNPAGRMPLSMPRQDSDFPSWEEDVFRRFTVNLDGGYRWLDENNITPEYAFGFGLSYTTFSYSNLVMPTAVAAGEPFTATVTVTNTGSIAGEEVVQLYVCAPSGTSLWMPKKQLRGFQRIALAAGETKTVTFNFCADHFYYWNETSKKYEVQPGSYVFKVGGSSDNLPLSQTVTFNDGAKKPDLRITQIYTMPRYPIKGQPVSFYALVKNQGNATTQTPYNISFKVSGKEVATASQITTTIAPGQVQLIASGKEWNADNIEKTTLSAQVSFETSGTEWDSENNNFARDYEVFSPAVDSTLTNLAYMKNVTASSEYKTNYSSFIVDGDLSTRWESGRTDNESVTIDLEAIGEIKNITIYWEVAYAQKYSIEKSMDGKTWNEIKNIMTGAGGVTSYDFDKFQARYIRIKCLERTTINSYKYGFSIYEVEVNGTLVQRMPSVKIVPIKDPLILPYAKTYLDGTLSTNPDPSEMTYLWKQVSGPAQAVIENPNSALSVVNFNTAGTYVFQLSISNGTNTDSKEISIVVKSVDATIDLAFKKPTSASSSEKISTYPQAAVDGDDANTRWSSSYNNNQWWQVDLLHQVTPSSISIIWQTAYAKKFNVQISADGTTWNTYATNDAFTGGTSTLANINTVTGRYVRVNCVERQTTYGSSFFSFKLFGTFPGTNQIPKAKAQSSLNTLDKTIILDGTTSTDADGDALTYKWEQLSGPTFVNIANAQSAVASITGIKNGFYSFKLTVNDGKDLDFTIINVSMGLNTQTPQINGGESAIKVYPNPVKNMLYIRNSGVTKADRVDIYSITGTLVMSQRITEDNISVYHLSAGIYCVRIFSRNKVIGIMTIIKEN